MKAKNIESITNDSNSVGVSFVKRRGINIDRGHKNYRVYQREVIYVIGIPQHLAYEKILRSNKYFGQYGEITRIFVSKKAYKLRLTKDYCYSAYLTFKHPVSASLAIVALDRFSHKGKKLEASFGTNKYCKYYLNKEFCKNKNCNFIHYDIPEEDCFVKDHRIENKEIFQGQKMYAYNQIQLKKDTIEAIVNKGNYSSNSVFPNITKVIKKVDKKFSEKKQTFENVIFSESCNSDSKFNNRVKKSFLREEFPQEMASTRGPEECESIWTRKSGKFNRGSVKSDMPHRKHSGFTQKLHNFRTLNKTGNDPIEGTSEASGSRKKMSIKSTPFNPNEFIEVDICKCPSCMYERDCALLGQSVLHFLTNQRQSLNTYSPKNFNNPNPRHNSLNTNQQPMKNNQFPLRSGFSRECQEDSDSSDQE